jgi:hypothetical protein
MTDLERTLRTLVDHPAAEPTDLATIERRAGRLRLRRRAGTVVAVAAALAVVGVSFGVVSDLTTPPPIVGEPTEDPDDVVPPSPQETTDEDPTEAPTEGATDAPTEEEASANPETDPPSWLTTEEKDAWQAETGRDGMWVAGYYYPPDTISDVDSNVSPELLELRWRRIADEGEDLERTELVRMAFDALAGATPDGLDNAFAGGAALDVVSVEVTADGRAIVVFTDELSDSTSTGSSGALAMSLQMEAMFLHYFPEATEGCIATERTVDDPESTIAFHDLQVCPFALRR